MDWSPAVLGGQDVRATGNICAGAQQALLKYVLEFVVGQ